MTSLGKHGGELTIDHSNSPGIPPDLAAKWRAQGIPVAEAGEKLEMATFACSHCNSIVLLNPARKRPREVCRKCMHVVCDRCVDNCTPFEAIAERVMAGRQLTVDQGTNLLLPTGIGLTTTAH